MFDRKNPGTELNPHYSRSGGWSASGILRTGSETDEVSLQANFPEASNYTVEFNLIAPDDILTPADAQFAVRAEALISWSVEGNRVTRRVNVGNGVSVTGVGQACKVVIKDTSDRNPVDKNVLGRSYLVSTQVAPGVRASTEQPPTLAPFPGKNAGSIIVPAASILDVPIPNDAGVLSVSVNVVPIGFLPLPEFGLIVIQRSLTIDLKSYDPRIGIWVPIAPGADVIRLANQSAIDVECQVTFGIDG